MKLPSRKKCLTWYAEYDTPKNIIDHVLMVNKVANFLAGELSTKVDINKGMVDRASLLHDLDKWLCINDHNLNHGFETERILQLKGYPELGFFARQHRADMILHGLKTWEEKIISYADRRVLRDKIVTIDERFEYLATRYPENKQHREKIIEMFQELEKELFSFLDFKPTDLGHLICKSL